MGFREMDRDTLLYKICPMHRINDCCEGTSDFHCEDCAQLMDEWLDEYDKQIRAKAIDDCLETVKFHRNTWDGVELAIRDIEELKAGVTSEAYNK